MLLMLLHPSVWPSVAPRGLTALMLPLQRASISLNGQSIGIGAQWRELATGSRRQCEKHYSPSDGKEESEGESEVVCRC